jgi:drug/metabolite transporter (DMT)-like permease
MVPSRYLMATFKSIRLFVASAGPSLAVDPVEAPPMDATPTPRYPAATLALALALLGTVGAFATEARVDPVTLVFWRCVAATLFLGGWCLARGHLTRDQLAPARLARAALGGVCMVLSWIGFFAGFSLTSIATTTIVYHVQPFFVVLLGALVFRERVRLDQVAWMALAFAGVALASGIGGPARAAGGGWLLGVLLTLGAALLYAVATLLAKGLGAQRPEVTTLCQTVVGILLLAPLVHGSRPVPAASWAWLAGIGLLHTGVAYVLMYRAYPHLGTPVIGVLTFIYPAVAILVDWRLYAHPLGLGQGLGMALIAVATLGVKLGWRFLPRRAGVAGRPLGPVPVPPDARG